MVKMLRLTSSDPEGNFNGFLKQELNLKPNSKIALQSLVFEAADRKLIINAKNDTVEFQTSNQAGVTTIVLTHTDGSSTRPLFYDSTNLQLFFDDITAKINNQFKLSNPSQIGQQFKLYVDVDGLIIADFQKGSYNAHNGKIDPSDNFPGNISKSAAQEDTIVYVPTGGLYSRVGADDGILDYTNPACYKANSYFSYPISKGCGVWRARVSQFQKLSGTGGQDVFGGFTIALSKRNPHTSTDPFQHSDIIMGIQCLSAETTNALYTCIINGGTPTTDTSLGNNPNAIAGRTSADGTSINGLPANSPASDVIELNIQGDGTKRVVNAVVYQRTGVPAVPDPITFVSTSIGQMDYAVADEQGDDLYGYMFLHGATPAANTHTCRLGNLRYTNDPFSQSAGLPTLALSKGVTVFRDDENEIIEDMPITIPQPSKNPNTNYFINFNFKGIETETLLAEWLGFKHDRNPIIGFSNGKSVSFKADFLFGSKIVADSFIVQLLNLPLKSYDMSAERQGRENILAIVPVNDNDLFVEFEPNNLLFLDIDNANEIQLVNLRLRILRQDYKSISTRGLSTIVLIVD